MKRQDARTEGRKIRRKEMKGAKAQRPRHRIHHIHDYSAAPIIILPSPPPTIHAPQTLLLRIVLLPRPVVALRLRLLRLRDDWSIPR